MSEPEIKMLSDIAVKVSRLEANGEANAKAIGDMAHSVNRLVDKLDRSDDIAREADQRAKSAHHRIDKVESDTDKRLGGVQDDIKWLWRTVLGAIIAGVIAGGIALIWKTIGA
ncbi:hemolysin XhlA family protein [Paenibacillus koleovorans]|uniref:hemolysin XhlA family protein n=1 Tax=Paenibacillus koleovorans TaxID=121608 RepID=UPI001FE4C74A|nr:hemolysin XhlA family protein [Paenibacillus koleovorans]